MRGEGNICSEGKKPNVSGCAIALDTQIRCGFECDRHHPHLGITPNSPVDFTEGPLL
ncbi:hypothetical protein [Laspinema olomoucense]|uniref:hypothetical protein n=1 Tax=Laspinema olomoucense TaxID=3231600 RepID=UPI0021BB9E71|nr:MULTISPECIES: hypothetical protein [unclassified Laspinema]MCT7989323.1 hypothetical protein [Laspinema sp. D3a]MCT7996099.1 hypothetical protein [Laspinema sp. D3c]